MCSLLLSSIISSNECVNSIIFPGSTLSSNYYPDTFKSKQRAQNCRLLYVPTHLKLQYKDNEYDDLSCCLPCDIPNHIPTLLVWRETNANAFIIYLHGNAADIGNVYNMAQRQSRLYHAHFLAVEYPRYGFSTGNPNEKSINKIVKYIYHFVIEILKIPSNKIIIYGNSIGTGPSCYLASYLETIGQPCKALILHAPFTSLNDVASDVLDCLPYCFLNRWLSYERVVGKKMYVNPTVLPSLMNKRNEATFSTSLASTDDESVTSERILDSSSSNTGEDIGVIRSPIFFIHADNDKIIDYNHSLMMHQQRLAKHLPSFMYTQKSSDNFTKGHNHFNYINDIEEPIHQFLIAQNIIPNPLQHSQQQSLQQQQSSIGSKTDTADEMTAADHYIPQYSDIIIDKELVESFSAIPLEYQHISTQTKDKLRKSTALPVLLRWFTCPCVCLPEAFLAANLQCCMCTKKALCQKRTGTQLEMVEFEYQTKAMRGVDHLTLSSVCFRLITKGKITDIIEEPANRSSNATQTTQPATKNPLVNNSN